MDFAFLLIRGCWPLFCVYPLMSKFLRMKRLRMAANLRKPGTLIPEKIKAHMVFRTNAQMAPNPPTPPLPPVGVVA